MLLEKLESTLLATPGLGRLYANRAASLKRGVCLALHRAGRLRPSTFVQWICTRACNLSCPYCEARAGRPGPDELTTAEAEGFIDDLAATRVRRLLVSGGEPLMRGDLLGLLAHARQRQLAVGLVSNGYLTEARWQELRQLRFFLYFTSIDGLPEYNDRVRGGKNAFDRALDSLERFASLKTPVRMLNTVVHSDNLAQLPELFERVRRSRATLWRLAPLALVGRARETPSNQLDGGGLRQVVDFVRASRRQFNVDLAEAHAYLGCFAGKAVGKPFFCGAGLTRASVLPDGTVVGCQVVEDRALAEGNLRDRRFSEIWRSEFARFRSPSLPARCAGCRFAGGCAGGCWGETANGGSCMKATWFSTP